MHDQAIQVAPIQQQDYQQWLEHWKGYQTFYQVELSNDITQITWNRFFDPNVPMHCAVAKDGEQILGFVHFLFHLSTWSITNYCYLEDLFVAPSARGKHIGKQLIEYVQKQANLENCSRLYWHTQETNHTAQKLYDWIAHKSGMIQYRMPL